MFFEIVGSIERTETIATGSGIREIRQLRAKYGDGKWRKCKGIASIRLQDGRIRLAEVHWYEAHRLGKRKLKLKRFLD